MTETKEAKKPLVQINWRNIRKSQIATMGILVLIVIAALAFVFLFKGLPLGPPTGPQGGGSPASPIVDNADAEQRTDQLSNDLIASTGTIDSMIESLQK